MKRRYAVIDYETFSEAELSSGQGKPGVGAYEYSLHPSTEILCVAWRVGTREELAHSTEDDTKVWAPRWKTPLSDLSGFLEILFDPDLTLVSHNAFFEQCITRNLFAKKYMYSMKDKILAAVGPERWYCIAAQVQALSLLRSLEKVGNILDLKIKKDKEGSRLLRKWMKPIKHRDGSFSRADDPKEFERLVAYCKTDISSEVEAFVTTPMLSPSERKIYQFDQMVNFRGFSVDRTMVESAVTMIEREKAALQAEACDITGGMVTSVAGAPGQIKKWLETQGVFMPSIAAESVKEAIAEGLVDGEALTVLKLRQSAAMSSVSKYPVMERSSRSDGRCRGCFIYHGAATGRWVGSLVNPHNLKKAPDWLKDTPHWAELIASGDSDTIKMLFGNPIPVLAGCIRSAVIASPGKKLHVADWNAIEARVVFWIADDDVGLDLFRSGKDIYIDQAAQIFGIKAENVDDYQRSIGKAAKLGCGFGMGDKRFTVQYNVDPKIGKAAVMSYRKTHHKVVSFWYDVEAAAIKAVKSGQKIRCGKVSFYADDRFLFCELPSGRRIAYFKPEIRYEDKWKSGNKSPVLYFWGENPRPPKGTWVRQSTYGGMLTENIVQATARDIMVSAMMRAESSGWEVVLHVHDEIAAEVDQYSKKSIDDFCRVLSELPPWAEGCPIKVGGFESKRYRK